MMDEAAPSSPLAPTARRHQAPDPEVLSSPEPAARRGVPTDGEHDTAELRPAKRQTTVGPFARGDLDEALGACHWSWAYRAWCGCAGC